MSRCLSFKPHLLCGSNLFKQQQAAVFSKQALTNQLFTTCLQHLNSRQTKSQELVENYRSTFHNLNDPKDFRCLCNVDILILPSTLFSDINISHCFQPRRKIKVNKIKYSVIKSNHQIKFIYKAHLKTSRVDQSAVQ